MSFGSDNGLASNRRQAIIWINGGLVYWHIICIARPRWISRVGYLALGVMAMFLLTRFSYDPILTPVSVYSSRPLKMDVAWKLSTIFVVVAVCQVGARASTARLWLVITTLQLALESVAAIYEQKNRDRVILGMGSATKRRRYGVTSSLIGWTHTKNDLWRTNI